VDVAADSDKLATPVRVLIPNVVALEGQAVGGPDNFGDAGITPPLGMGAWLQ